MQGKLALNRSLLIFMLCRAFFTIAVTLLANTGMMSTSFVKTLGTTLCLCLAALAMDLVRGATRASFRQVIWRSSRSVAT